MIENSLNSNPNQGNKIKNKKILFVDSSKRIRNALSIFFEFEGCSFRSLKSPEKALKALQNNAYDIIIADYYLPGLNGLELLNFVKSNYPNTIGILITSFGDRKLVEEAKEAGIRDVIQKPFSADILVSRLSQLFEFG